jgi:hypothetical protein
LRFRKSGAWTAPGNYLMISSAPGLGRISGEWVPLQSQKTFGDQVIDGVPLLSGQGFSHGTVIKLHRASPS